ncbi:hypothetical protein HMPREF9371_1042 [Neisseria shayeganii 871]|uniref:Uncharacterized protein n=1 Tax=Neisseria shayeganii 871 TaxID=1032488 RepID=G4CHF3_9NEIS|nr:hypothetical protein HMPREF9371_1042 [Neisseria shayeganii 871]
MVSAGGQGIQVACRRLGRFMFRLPENRAGNLRPPCVYSPEGQL